MAVIGSGVCIIVLMTLSSIFNGYALSVLWRWFMVPTLGFPVISVVQAIGIAMVVRFLTYQFYYDKDKDESKALLHSTVFAFLYPAFALSIGWVVNLFM